MSDIIKKTVIRYWLDNYASLVANDKPIDAIPSNSGQKSYDGVSWRQINKIMLEDAINKLPELLNKCVDARWINPKPLGETLRKLGLTKDVYYKRCSWAVDSIYYQINSYAARLQELYNKIEEIS